LLLRHAFEGQNAGRVAIKTDLRNIRSQRAIERLSAKREGVWRNHRTLSDGSYRHSVYYSIIDSEWRTLREHLVASVRTKTSTK
jgi:RimJ/RimL family protein N-acetyltransferase